MILAIVLGGFVGAVVGSAATALQHRYENITTFIVGRSECEHCHKKLQWFDMIPIVSWLMLKGVCRKCNKPIGWPSFVIELSFAVIGAFAVYHFGAAWWLGFMAVLFVLFGALVLVDIQDQLLPNALIIAAIPFLIVLGWNAPTIMLSIVKSLEGLLVAGGVLGLLWLVTKGKGIGDGDVKLAAALGLGVGPALGVITVMGAFILGGVVASYLLASGKAKLGFGQRVAFGPLLILGYTIALFFGPVILSWYSY